MQYDSNALEDGLQLVTWPPSSFERRHNGGLEPHAFDSSPFRSSSAEPIAPTRSPVTPPRATRRVATTTEPSPSKPDLEQLLGIGSESRQLWPPREGASRDVFGTPSRVYSRRDPDVQESGDNPLTLPPGVVDPRDGEWFAQELCKLLPPGEVTEWLEREEMGRQWEERYRQHPLERQQQQQQQQQKQVEVTEEAEVREGADDQEGEMHDGEEGEEDDRVEEGEYEEEDEKDEEGVEEQVSSQLASVPWQQLQPPPGWDFSDPAVWLPQPAPQQLPSNFQQFQPTFQQSHSNPAFAPLQPTPLPFQPTITMDYHRVAEQLTSMPLNAVVAFDRIATKSFAVVDGHYPALAMGATCHYITTNMGGHFSVELRPRAEQRVDYLLTHDITDIPPGWGHLPIVDLWWIRGLPEGVMLPPSTPGLVVGLSLEEIAQLTEFLGLAGHGPSEEVNEADADMDCDEDDTGYDEGEYDDDNLEYKEDQAASEDEDMELDENNMVNDQENSEGDVMLEEPFGPYEQGSATNNGQAITPLPMEVFNSWYMEVEAAQLHNTINSTPPPPTVHGVQPAIEQAFLSSSPTSIGAVAALGAVATAAATPSSTLPGNSVHSTPVQPTTPTPDPSEKDGSYASDKELAPSQPVSPACASYCSTLRRGPSDSPGIGASSSSPTICPPLVPVPTSAATGSSGPGPRGGTPPDAAAASLHAAATSTLTALTTKDTPMAKMTRYDPPCFGWTRVGVLEEMIADMNRYSWGGKNTLQWWCRAWERKYMVPFNAAEFVLLYKADIAARCLGFALAIHDPRLGVLVTTTNTTPPPRPSNSTPTLADSAGATCAVDPQDPIAKEREFRDLVVSAMNKYDWDAQGASKADFYSWWMHNYPNQRRIESWCQLHKRELSELCEGFRMRSGAAFRKLRKEKGKGSTKGKGTAKAKGKGKGKEKEKDMEVDEEEKWYF